jgi:hypothetical protein
VGGTVRQAVRNSLTGRAICLDSPPSMSGLCRNQSTPQPRPEPTPFVQRTDKTMSAHAPRSLNVGQTVRARMGRARGTRRSHGHVTYFSSNRDDGGCELVLHDPVQRATPRDVERLRDVARARTPWPRSQLKAGAARDKRRRYEGRGRAAGHAGPHSRERAPARQPVQLVSQGGGPARARAVGRANDRGHSAPSSRGRPRSTRTTRQPCGSWIESWARWRASVGTLPAHTDVKAVTGSGGSRPTIAARTAAGVQPAAVIPSCVAPAYGVC